MFAIAGYTSCLLVCLCRLSAGWKLPNPLWKENGYDSNRDGVLQRRFRAADSLVSNRETKCSGGFDIYFVLDRSASVSENYFQQQTVNFVEALLDRFTSSKVRSSFITFSTNAQVVTKLTADRDELDRGIEQLRQAVTEGGTYLHYGIKEARKQIQETGGDTASVIVTLTDGMLDDKVNSIAQANSARHAGASVLAVRVGDSRIKDLIDVADKPTAEHIFRGNSFNDLNHIIDKIVNTSCVEILSASPTVVCAGVSFNVTINGNGFSRTNDLSKVLCNFRLNDTDNQEVSPYLVTEKEMVCPAPHIEEPGSFVVLQVSVNGISYISSNVTITSEDCTPPQVTAIILGVLFALLLLGLILLWWFWKLICCVVVVKDPPQQAPPASPTSKKWPTVDASYYGGGGVGGIKAMRVNWGENGCTEGGSHLEKARGAKTLAVNEEGTGGQLREGGMGCFENFKRKIASCFAPVKSLYDRISVMRPAPGEKGICCKVRR